jgi:hypothetical protein
VLLIRSNLNTRPLPGSCRSRKWPIVPLRYYTPGPEQSEDHCLEVADRPAEVLHARPGTKRRPLPGSGRSSRLDITRQVRNKANTVAGKWPIVPLRYYSQGRNKAKTIAWKSPIVQLRCYTPSPEQSEDRCREVADRPAEILHARPGTKPTPLPGSGRSSR